MSALKKLTLSGLSLLGFAGVAQSAGAQTITPTLVNASRYPVTTSDVNWRGSYSPRIEGTYLAGATPSGEHRFANPRYSRYTSLDFKVSYTTPDGDKRTCLFWYDFQSDTGAHNSSGASKIAGTTLPKCELIRTGTYAFRFTIGEP